MPRTRYVHEKVTVPQTVYMLKNDPFDEKKSLWVEYPVESVSPTGATFKVDGRTFNTPDVGNDAWERGHSTGYRSSYHVYFKPKRWHDDKLEVAPLTREQFAARREEKNRKDEDAINAMPFDEWFIMYCRMYPRGVAERLEKETVEDRAKYIVWMAEEIIALQEEAKKVRDAFDSIANRVDDYKNRIKKEVYVMPLSNPDRVSRRW